jgi:hypothetical protein
MLNEAQTQQVLEFIKLSEELDYLLSEGCINTGHYEIPVDFSYKLKDLKQSLGLL